MTHDFWRSYASCWSAPDAQRTELLPQLTSADVSYRDPMTEVRGREAFSAYMKQFQNGYPGHRFDVERVDAHHDRSLARWQLIDPSGQPVQRGVSSAVHDEEGRLRDVTGFFQAQS